MKHGVVLGGFEHVAHTADVGIRAFAPTIADAFVQACRAYTAVIMDPKAIDHTVEKPVTLRARNKEALLYDLIAELIYFSDIDGFLPATGELTISREQKTWLLKGTLFGACRKEETHGAVKAMTYHGLALTEQPGNVTLEFVLDL